MKVSDEPIVVEQSFENSTEEVWSAITELNPMREWFFDNIEAFEPKLDSKRVLRYTQENAHLPIFGK